MLMGLSNIAQVLIALRSVKLMDVQILSQDIHVLKFSSVMKPTVVLMFG